MPEIIASNKTTVSPMRTLQKNGIFSIYLMQVVFFSSEIFFNSLSLFESVDVALRGRIFIIRFI